MVADQEAVRRRAAFAVARALGRHQTRELFEASGYSSDEAVVVALESDTVGSVLSRVRQHDPPVAVAIFWPESGRLEYTSFKPGDDEELGSDQQSIGGSATIGMLFEHAKRQRSAKFRFNLTSWDRPTMNIDRFEAAPA